MAWPDIFLKALKDNGAGLSNNHWVRDKQHFDQLLDRRFDEGGPMLLAVKIDDQPGPVQTLRDPMLIRASFMKGMGTSKAGALG